ncbi:rhodanese-like domain-containing protein [Nodosilinea sp. E11]|uniref:rhodanese-like domain-containing protein n=1 Tax=Nodosilinea sp. E11 TaxID=3037479 RepID=UPI0029351A2F|nr:rhodanese-like domain-containing protein [Nodosilinea sp. E11]WOD41286.1 rhodanese-like domain-containing protein [Nodosilinea sp. E11]
MTVSPDAAPYEPLSVDALAQRLAEGDDTLQLIDVREPQEVETASLAGFENLPLSEYATWSETIHSRFERDRETIVLCHHGMRSAQMCMWLAQQGFTQLKNVTGGIDAYALTVDRSVPRY